MRKIKNLNLTKAVKLKDNSFLLTLRINGADTNYTVSFDQEFVPRMFGVTDNLRAILTDNPQATQEIIRTLSAIEQNKVVIFPIVLQVWQDIPVAELQIA